MIWYILLQLGFHSVAVVGRLVQKWERDNTEGETIHRTIQKHRIHKIKKKTKFQNKNAQKEY